MSRAFVKEDDSGQPPIIPPRPALPPGTPNYVTPQGLELLRAEMDTLEAEKSSIEAQLRDEAERTRLLTILNGRMSALNERLSTAKLIDPRNQPADEVRFGATVKLRTLSGLQPGLERSFTIVGIDEASVAEGKVAFVAPIARAIVGKRKGEKAQLRMARQVEEVEILDIQYSTDTPTPLD